MKIPKELREQSRTRQCLVKGCENQATRTMPEPEWEGYLRLAKLSYQKHNGKVHLCKSHYNTSKRYREKQKALDRKKGFPENSRNYERNIQNYR